MMRPRQLRVREAIRDEVADILRRELRDPRVGFTSVTDVEVSEDLRHARVYVSVLGGEEERRRTIEGLEQARGFIRASLGRRLRLRFVPELAFSLDRSLERGQRISGLLARARAEASPRASLELDRREIADYLRERDRFVILLHVRPDGDSVGSSLALALALRKLGKTARVVRSDELPANLRFLPGVEQVLPCEEALALPERYDGAVLIDCGDRERVGPAAPLLERAERVINIDHHLSNRRFGHLNCVDPQAAAAGEIVYAILRDLGVELDFEIASAIYAAVVTDTGSFRYENTSPATHELAAALLRLGVQPAEVARHIWEDKPLSSLRLLQRALASLQVGEGGLLAWMALSREDFQEAGARPGESEGIVNYARSLAGVEVAALFLEEGTGEVKVSLRSSRWVDVSRVAEALGGGGHARAAGCTLRATLPEAQELVLAKVREALAAGAGLAALASRGREQG